MGIINNMANALKNALGTTHIKAQATGLTKIANDVFTVPKGPEKKETFEEALTRLQLTEGDLERRKVQFMKLARIYLFLAAVIFLYSIYLAIKKAFFPMLGCFGLLLIVFSQYFRCSFWLFQIRERRLGCTFFEWLSEMTGKR